MTTKPFYIAGEWRNGEGTLDVHSPYDDSVVATIAAAQIRTDFMGFSFRCEGKSG